MGLVRHTEAEPMQEAAHSALETIMSLIQTILIIHVKKYIQMDLGMELLTQPLGVAQQQKEQ